MTFSQFGWGELNWYTNRVAIHFPFHPVEVCLPGSQHHHLASPPKGEELYMIVSLAGSGRAADHAGHVPTSAAPRPPSYPLRKRGTLLGSLKKESFLLESDPGHLPLWKNFPKTRR